VSVRLLPGSWPTTAAAEHDARDHLLARDGFSGTMCTHIVPERQHIVVTVADDADLTDEPIAPQTICWRGTQLRGRMRAGRVAGRSSSREVTS